MIYYETGGNRCVKISSAEMQSIKTLPDRRTAINNILSAYGLDITKPYNERLEGKDAVYEQPK